MKPSKPRSRWMRISCPRCSRRRDGSSALHTPAGAGDVSRMPESGAAGDTLAGHAPPAARARRDVVERHALGLQRAIRISSGGRSPGRLPAPPAQRWREAASIMARQSQPYNAECNQLHVPRLPAIPFYDRRVSVAGGARSADRRDPRGAVAALEAERDRFSPTSTNAGRSGQPVEGAEPLDAMERVAPVARRHTRWRRTWSAARRRPRCSRDPMADIGGLCPTPCSLRWRRTPKFRRIMAKPMRDWSSTCRSSSRSCWYRVGFEERGWRGRRNARLRRHDRA